MFSQRKPAKSGAVKSEGTQAPPSRPVRTGPVAPSIISADVELIGNLSTSGDVHIDGNVKGNLRAANIVVGDSATISGDVIADDLTVYGRIEGHLFARRVKLCAKCHVEGDIHHEALTVEHGAIFTGNCRHSTDPVNSGKAMPKLIGSNGARPAAAGDMDDDETTAIFEELSARRRS